MCFLHDLGRHLRLCTGDPNSFMYLLQHLSVAIQVGNSTSVIGSLVNKFNDCNSEDFIWLHVVFVFSVYFLFVFILIFVFVMSFTCTFIIIIIIIPIFVNLTA